MIIKISFYMFKLIVKDLWMVLKRVSQQVCWSAFCKD